MASFCGAPGGFDDDDGPARECATGGPVLAGGPVVFMCCDPCFDGRCGKLDCDHEALDQKEFENAQDAIELLHPDCFCYVMPKEETDAQPGR